MGTKITVKRTAKNREDRSHFSVWIELQLASREFESYTSSPLIVYSGPDEDVADRIFEDLSGRIEICNPVG